MTATAVLILVVIYSPFAIGIEPRGDLGSCIEEARGKIGESMRVLAWDDMNGSNPIPKVIAAFCAQGAAADR
jgi:hypothetical protein